MFVIILLLSFASVHSQFPPWNRNPAVIRGNLLSNDLSTLPFDSRIFISLADVSLQDAPARVLNTVTLSGSHRFPIPFELPYPSVSMNPGMRYSIQARIERNGQLLYINNQYTPISMSPINVFMKKVGGSIHNPGTYRTRFPTRLTNVYRCQLPPDAGSCFASIRQYYFNAQTQMCLDFIYGGCGGNQNRFISRDECERACSNVPRGNINRYPIG